MKNITSLILIIIFSGSVSAQTETEATAFAESIVEDDLYDHLSVLASDAMQGRATGEAGQKMAAAYIASHFQEMGLEGPVKNGENQGFYQPVTLYSVKQGEIYLKMGKKIIMNDFNNLIYFGQGFTAGEVSEEVVFAGRGTAEDFESADVKGKGVLIMVNNSRAWKDPAKLAKKHGASMVYVVNTADDDAFELLGGLWQHHLKGGTMVLKKPEEKPGGVFLMKPSLAAKMMKTDMETLRSAVDDPSIREKIKPANVSYKLTIEVDTTATENVLGYLEGTDKKDELVVLTAHYDHVGMDGDDVYNGADDDGSGTSAILELAEAFSKARKAGKGPRRSMLFMTVTGEEKGLLGSEYYSENPVFPLANTIADLNIDMIGRIDAKHEDNPEYVYLVGSDRLSSELHEISEKVNATYTHLEIDYTYNDEAHPDRIYYRSDHWNFAKNNIPIIFYFNGVHEDYHKPTDTIEKIDFNMLRKRTELVFYTAWVLANRDERIVTDNLQDQTLNND